jgi:hypothetical protein
MANIWKIIDDNGTIYSGQQDDMDNIFSIMSRPEEHSKEEISIYEIEWDGYLHLIEIHATHK